jgi:hypothetical protein
MYSPDYLEFIRGNRQAENIGIRSDTNRDHLFGVVYPVDERRDPADTGKDRRLDLLPAPGGGEVVQVFIGDVLDHAGLPFYGIGYVRPRSFVDYEPYVGNGGSNELEALRLRQHTASGISSR